jgi:hypothetical protein
MYFEMMPKMMMNLYGDRTSYKMVTDITTRIIGSMEIRENVFLYEYVDILDTDTPEMVSYKAYGDPNYHWVVMLCNDVIDPVYDWIMSYDAILAHCIAMYGEEGIYHTHHYENEFGDWVDSTYPNPRFVTNIQYMEEENEKKRSIKLLQARYLPAFVEEVKMKLKEQVQ